MESRMKKASGLAGAALLLLAGPTFAADLGARPSVASVIGWTGCYLGVNGGWIGGGDDYATQPGPASAFNGQNFNPSPNSHAYSSSGSSGTAGGQAGCDYQIGGWVLGVEGDFNWSGLKESDSVSYLTIAQAAPAMSWTTHTETVGKDLGWFSTVRARLGYTVTPTWLIYGTGGLAVASVKTSLNYDATATDPAFHMVGSNSATKAGWAAGGGTEWMFAQNWSLKAEYLYLDLGAAGFDAPNIAGGPSDLRSWRLDTRLREEVARVGLNYRF
jgi:outer membrane immunogenic protein